ncbi:hypothetical protein CBL_00211 [Carabus blaptoides fortunei]
MQQIGVGPKVMNVPSGLDRESSEEENRTKIEALLIERGVPGQSDCPCLCDVRACLPRLWPRECTGDIFLSVHRLADKCIICTSHHSSRHKSLTCQNENAQSQRT